MIFDVNPRIQENAFPKYGRDFPHLAIVLILIGACLLSLGFGLLFRYRFGDFALSGFVLCLIGLFPTILGSSLVAYSWIGKFVIRDALLDSVPWQGSEEVLDIGTGAGLLLVGAAKRLTTGHIVGIDIWLEKDLSGNTPSAAYFNAVVEGVSNKVEIKTADASLLPMPDAYFDRVLSQLCFSSLGDEEKSFNVFSEIWRVLKPGGLLIFAENIPPSSLSLPLEASGFTLLQVTNCSTKAFTFMWLIIAEKKTQF